MAKAFTLITGVPGSTGMSLMRRLMPPMNGMPSTSTRTPSGTTISTPPMMATAVTVISAPVSSAARKSRWQPPQKARALTCSAGRQRPLRTPPHMTPTTQFVWRGGRVRAAASVVAASTVMGPSSAATVSRSARVVAASTPVTRSENSSNVSVPSAQWVRSSAMTWSRSASVTRSARGTPSSGRSSIRANVPRPDAATPAR